MNSKMAQPKHNHSRISEFGPNGYTTPYLNFIPGVLLRHEPYNAYKSVCSSNDTRLLIKNSRRVKVNTRHLPLPEQTLLYAL